jgi:maleate isomerase
MFEESLPRFKVGCLTPLGVIGNEPYEFYRLAPPGILLLMIPVGLSEFSKADVERVFEPLPAFLDQLTTRGVDLIIQNGVPLPILLGLDGHDRLVEKMASYSKVPSTSTVTAIVKSTAEIGVKTVVVANKWSDEMNANLKQFFAREGVSVCGVSNKSLKPSEFLRLSQASHAELAWDLGRRALIDHPEADALYIGGGSWMAEPVCRKLEEEFGKPVICNQTSRVRHIMRMLGAWAPIKGHGRLLEAA